MPKTIIVSKEEARAKITSAINKVADVVGSTLGSHGRNVLIDRGEYRVPKVTNDGVTIARSIHLQDDAEAVVARFFIDVCKKSNDKVGDGTTTAAVLAQAIYAEGIEEFGAFGEGNPMEYRRKLMAECALVIQKLKDMAQPVDINDVEMLARVAAVSMENEDHGKTIAEIVSKVGVDGYVTVDDTYGYEVETNMIPGMQFYGTYAAPFMVTDPGRKEATLPNARILITNHDIEDPTAVGELIRDLLGKGIRTLVIVAPKFKEMALNAFAYALTKKDETKRMYILAVKAPSLTEEQFEDIAVYTKGQFFKKSMKLKNAAEADLGFVEKIVVDKDYTVLFGGKGKEVDANDKTAVSEVTKRVATLQEQLAAETNPTFKVILGKRIGSLSQGVAQIKVGATTDADKNYLKDKFEDAVHATQAAAEEGIVPGGGLALKTISEALTKEFGDKSVLAKALLAPYERIQKNAGGTLEIPENIVDPVKVTRYAVEHACSVAGILLTADHIVADKKDDPKEVLRNMVNGMDDGDDD